MHLKYYLFLLLLFNLIGVNAETVKDSISTIIESYKLNTGYIKSLTNRVDFYFDLGSYDKTIEIAEERQKIIEVVMGRDSYEFLLYQAELASFYSLVNKNDKAIELIKASIKCLEKDNDSLIILARTDMEYHLSGYYNLVNDYNNSLVYAQKVLEVYKELYGVNNEKYISALERVASCMTDLSRSKEAITMQKTILEYRKNHNDSLNYAIISCDISRSYAAIGNYEEAISFCIQGQEILERLLGEDNLQSRQALTNLSSYYEKSGRFDDAIHISLRLSNICKKYFGIDSFEYAEALSCYSRHIYIRGDLTDAIDAEERSLKIKNTIIFDGIERERAVSLANLGFYYNVLGDMNKSIQYSKQALQLIDVSSYSLLYQNIISNLSKCYLEIGENDKANNLIITALKKCEDSQDYNGYYACLAIRATCFFYKEDYDKAIAILQDVLSYYRSKYGDNSIQCAPVLEELAHNYLRADQLRDALISQENSLKLQQLYYGKGSPQYACSLSSLGNLLFLVGDREKAIRYQEEAANIIKEKIGTDNIMYINILRILSNINDYNTDRKLELLGEIKKIIQSGKFALHQYISCMCELSEDYAKLGRNYEVNEIESCLTESPIVVDYFNNNQLAYAGFMNSIAECQSFLGNYEKALKKELVAYEIFKKEYGNEFHYYDNSISNLITCYANQKDSIHLYNFLKETNFFDYAQKKISDNVRLLPLYNRTMYWNRFFTPIFNDVLPFVAGLFHDEHFICLAYDMSALFAKGLLLKTETNVLDLIKKHGDLSIQLAYDKLLSDRIELEKMYDIEKKDSIMDVINKQEDDIIQKMDSLGLLEDYNVSWRDIQKQLNENDIAIEFLTCNIDSVKQLNAAFLLKKDFDFPIMVPIARKDQIDEYLTKGEIDSLYKKLWYPIEKYLEGVENVYFSPSGELHCIPMEYLICNDGQYMCERYNMFRLSSTKKLMSKSSNKKYSNAVLYGGLDYDMDLSKQDNKTQRLDTLNYVPMERGLRYSLSERSGFEPLLNTQKEVSEVSSILKKANIKCTLYIGQNGLEETFKAMSGVSYDILHISTHGVFIMSEDVEKMMYSNNFNFIRNSDLAYIVPEDNALSRSFLVLSGGNMLTKRKDIPKGVDDGILTAKEISNIDLLGADLVVLSACQTGLGDINSEGVWGLQRGFKKAGANTILMSLDKVDDEATRILMVEFYKNLMNGKTKHQSLKDAQKHLRSVENGKYDDPKYWASFIMLDGLN